MNIEDRIRTRAYFKWLNRPNRNSPSELDDWLSAEIEELALDLVDAASEVTLSQPSFRQDDLWLGTEQIAKLFDLLAVRLRKRRTQSYLLSLIELYQDYLTSSVPIVDEEANRIGEAALRIFRLITSLKVLIGNDLGLTATHSFRKELKDIFSENRTACETSEFNTYIAATIQARTGLAVSFINEDDETKPDLKVSNVAYVECKDIHTQNRNNIDKALTDNLAKAHEQLAAAQQRQPLVGTGVCIDMPWGTLPLTQPEWQVIRQALSASDAPQFLLVSASGINRTKEAIGFPVAVCLVWSVSGQPLFQTLIRKLTRLSYKMQPNGFDEFIH